MVNVTDSGLDEEVWAASLSPDGRSAAYVSTNSGETQFHVTPSDGTPGSQAPLDCPDPAQALTTTWSVRRRPDRRWDAGRGSSSSIRRRG